MARTGAESMETLQQALERLERSGFTASFRAMPGGRIGARVGRGEMSYAPQSMIVEEVVRFEGCSDPEDQAVLFALRSPDEELRGSFVATYGPQIDAETAAVVQGLRANPEARRQHAPG
jgi:hypothetical protein